MEKRDARALPEEDRPKKGRQFKGIRMRKWGKWVSEIRMPKSHEKIWLGSYNTAEQAARAYDAAVYCLRGPAAKLNFPETVPGIPSASSLSRQQIQHAAARYALGEIPLISPSLQNIDAREKPASSSRSSCNSETDLLSNSEKFSKELDFDLWESMFSGQDCLSLDQLPPIDEASALELIPPWQKQQ